MRTSTKFSIAVLLLATRSWAASSAAVQEFSPISASELQMKSEPLAPGAPAIILERRVDRDDRSGGGAHEDNYLRIKILTEEGRRFADVEIPFVPAIDSVTNLKARTIRPDGSVADFSGNIYEKEIAKGRNVKVRAKTFTFPDAQVGSILEYFFTLNLRAAYDSHWTLNSDLFTRHAQFSLRPMTNSFVPVRLHWIWKGIPGGAQPHEGPDHIIHLEVSNIPAFQEEDFMPPEDELKARVEFLYELQSAPSDPDKFWNQADREWNTGLEAFLHKHKAVEESVRQIVAPGDSPPDKLRKLYARVQALRNTSYELEKTAKEEKRNPEKPAESVEDVWKHGYGNSVQLTWLFLSFARAAGFEADGCWVASRTQRFFNSRLMQSDGLSANIVRVKLDGKEIYFDPGIPFTPFGMLPWNETATPGICLDNNGGAWIRTPLPESALSQTSRSARFRLSVTGDLDGKVTVILTGLEAAYQRLNAINQDEVARKQSIEQEIKSQIPAAAEVDLINHPDWDHSDTPLRMELKVKIPDWASSTGRRLLLPVGVFSKHEKNMFDRVERIHPIYFAYPFSESDDLNIELPPDWQAVSPAPAESRQGSSVTYAMKVEKSEAALHVTRQLSVDIFLLEPSQYSALRTFFQGLRSSDEQQIVLQPVNPNPAGKTSSRTRLTALPDAS